MELATKYDPSEVESSWYQRWMDAGYFNATPNPVREAYCVVMPPPNVTGVLHMGHMLNNTIQDILVRRARMQGKEACWVPGTDHASIATEAKVVAMLRERGIKKADLTREQFLEYAWEWRNKYGGIILQQLKKLGASCDWSRTTFTMDPAYSDAVVDVFIDLHRKGKIYRGLRMVNWDPAGKTALSDDEVIHREVASKLYYIQYPVVGNDGEFVTIATVRPETIMADTAICVNPNDPRYTHLKGKRVRIPLIDREIPVIEDDYVTMDFGTGCLKVTPAHDVNDYALGEKHNLDVIDILNEDGTLNAKATICVGDDRFVARKKVAKMLEAQGYLQKTEDYSSSVGFSERTNAVIEPRLSLQWFLSMKEITAPAHHNVMNDYVQLIPPKFKNTYNHWMTHVRDWCISRQLWWGHRIPAWYDADGHCVVARTLEEALEYYKKEKPGSTVTTLTQDNDVLDTWFSSWLWPIAVFDTTVFRDGNKGNADLNYFYPTNDLVTAPEILFFWVARMITAGYEYRGDKPFSNVYLTGIVRDHLGRKMSKSLGNSPDPLELIASHGADAVRTGMLFSAPAGNDLLYDEKLIEQGRNFANKVWNAFRLVKGLQIDDNLDQTEDNITAGAWFEERLTMALQEVDDHFVKFRISDALHTVYKLVWTDFCSWYLEMVKPDFGKPVDKITYEQMTGFFKTLLKLLHPFMPFITEELWSHLKDRNDVEHVIVAAWPPVKPGTTLFTEESERAFMMIKEIRDFRNKKGISPKETLTLHCATNPFPYFGGIIRKLANIREFQIGDNKPAGSTLMVGTLEFTVPLDMAVDPEKERAAIEKDLVYFRGFLTSVEKKLSNEKFVSSAPANVIEGERKKKADAELKIKTLEDSLANLNGGLKSI